MPKPSAGKKSSSRSAARPSGQVLIVEDDEFLAKMMARMLEAEGIACALASTGKEGLRRARQTKPRLIILDVILPDLDGFALLSKLKSDPATRHTPILIVSNLGQEEDVQQGLSLGAKDYIVKSDLSLDAVVAKVKKYLK